MSKTTIDFKFIKQEADLLAVLSHYGLKLEGKGVQRQALCPFHDDKRPSLKVNLGRKVFHCFGCGAKGNIYAFVMRKEGLGETEIRKAARKVADICGIPLAPPTGTPAKHAQKPGEQGLGSETMKETSVPQSSVTEPPVALDEASTNEPLSAEFVERFRAKLEGAHDHPFLRARGLSPVLIDHFELAYFPTSAKGMMRGRVVIAIHNERGELIAYCGRWASDDPLPEGAGKYLLPKGFNKSAALYNLHRVRDKKHLILVEGFFSVYRLAELGVPAVALMGRSISDEQIALLSEAGVKYLTVMLDGDEPGRSGACAMMERFAKEPFRVKFALLPDGSEPDTAPEAVLRELLNLRS
jgi:DNA primase